MAGTAVRTELALVIIIRGVAGIAVGGGAPEEVVDVTAQAGNFDVLTCQFEH